MDVDCRKQFGRFKWTPTPFHIHVNPFQVVQIENLATKVVTKVDEWRDSFVRLEGQETDGPHAFSRLSRQDGIHCHTLDHEDQGMMRTFPDQRSGTTRRWRRARREATGLHPARPPF